MRPVLAMALLALAAPLAAQSPSDSAPKRSSVGAVHHYVKSNLDGSHPTHVILYRAAEDRLEVLKREPENDAAAFVTAHLDLQSLSADTVRAAVLFPDGVRRDAATLALDPGPGRVDVTIQGIVDSLVVETIPIHIYNFDFASLAALFPELAARGDPFEIGVLNPTFAPEPPLVRYDGRARIQRVADDVRDGVPTGRYRVDGAAFAGTEGALWVTEDGTVVDMEFPLPDNPEWSSFKLRLRGVERMAPGDWERFVAEEQRRLGVPVELVGAPAEATDRLGPEVARARLAVEAFFGRGFADSVAVTVTPDRAAFTTWLQAEWGYPDTECWMVGGAEARRFILLDPAAWSTDACEHDGTDLEHVRQLLAHELVHAFHAQRSPRPDFDGMDEVGWFVEGLATYASGQLDGGGIPHRARAGEAVATSAAPTRLADAWSGKYRYGVAGTLVELVDRTWGRGMVRELLSAVSNDEILARLGLSEDELLARWRALVLPRAGH